MNQVELRRRKWYRYLIVKLLYIIFLWLLKVQCSRSVQAFFRVILCNSWSFTAVNLSDSGFQRDLPGLLRYTWPFELDTVDQIVCNGRIMQLAAICSSTYEMSNKLQCVAVSTCRHTHTTLQRSSSSSSSTSL